MIQLMVVIFIITIIVAIVISLYSTQIIKTKISNTRYDADNYVKDLVVYASTYS
ncbi:hypothetical protein [Francisella halioticida]